MKCKRCNGSGAEPDHALIGRGIKDRRLAIGRTLTQVAFGMGISVPYLCLLESGTRNWRPKLEAKAHKTIKNLSK